MLLAASPTPPASSSALPTAQSILAHMVVNRQGLNSFTVPVHFDIKVHKVIGLGIKLDGVSYFERPDREALVMQTVPALAKPFQKIFAGLGTPETWPSRYNISIVPLDAPNNATMYELNGVPKAGGNVDHVLLDISQTTFEPLKARWFYKNGATHRHGHSKRHGCQPIPLAEDRDFGDRLSVV